MNIKAPKGTKDVLPSESFKWQIIEQKMRSIAKLNGYSEIRTPTFESTELFARGVGETTDVVQKEMYTFNDKGERSITLKPEGTAGVVRAFIESGLQNNAQPTKLFYLNCPVFRYERPQAGRLREHHQFGVEVFGSQDSAIDAQIILLAWNLLKQLDIKDLELKINSIGCVECRPNYNKALKEYFSKNIENLCGDCKQRLEKNPMRLLDCKNPNCQEYKKDAPIILDYNCDSCKEHFHQLGQYLDIAKTNYSIDPLIVRGLDYYSNTVFEIVTNSIGAQGTICGGGRYNGLVEELGGIKTPGAGFGMGMERLLLLMEKLDYQWEKQSQTDVYICTFDETQKLQAFKIAQDLIGAGIRAEIDNISRSVKAQFKYADKIGAKFVCTIGEEEIKTKTLKIKNMQSKNSETTIATNEIVEFIKNY